MKACNNVLFDASKSVRRFESVGRLIPDNLLEFSFKKEKHQANLRDLLND